MFVVLAEVVVDITVRDAKAADGIPPKILLQHQLRDLVDKARYLFRFVGEQIFVRQTENVQVVLRGQTAIAF